MVRTNDYWVRQTRDKPAFPDLLWDRPERRDQAGKLLIIGGSKAGFTASATAYTIATKAGIGSCRVLLPNSLNKTLQAVFPEAEYAPSNPSGSFARTALGECLELAAWSDGVLLAGDTGHNSETTIVIESFLTKYSGRLTLTGDAITSIMPIMQQVFDRPQTVLVMTVAELQKTTQQLHATKPITHATRLLQMVELLHDFSQVHHAAIITEQAGHVLIASHGRVSTTPVTDTTGPGLVSYASSASVWYTQHGQKPFEALTASLLY